MELEEPTQAVCPVCLAETVDVHLNSKDRPYVTCQTHKTPINLNAGERSEERIRQFISLAEAGVDPSDVHVSVDGEPITSVLSEADGDADADDEPDDPEEVESAESDDGTPTLGDVFGGDSE